MNANHNHEMIFIYIDLHLFLLYCLLLNLSYFLLFIRIDPADTASTGHKLSINFANKHTFKQIATMETNFAMFGRCVHLQVRTIVGLRVANSNDLNCNSTFSYVHPYTGDEILVDDNHFEILSLKKLSSGKFCLKVSKFLTAKNPFS